MCFPVQFEARRCMYYLLGQKQNRTDTTRNERCVSLANEVNGRVIAGNDAIASSA